MKNFTLIFTIAVAALFSGCNKSSVHKSQLVNPLLGDISYETRFGYKPDETTDDNLRIRTHLEYVENLLIPIAFIKWSKDARLFFIKTMKKIVA
jgi:hypothetical protein